MYGNDAAIRSMTASRVGIEPDAGPTNRGHPSQSSRELGSDWAKALFLAPLPESRFRKWEAVPPRLPVSRALDGVENERTGVGVGGVLIEVDHVVNAGDRTVKRRLFRQVKYLLDELQDRTEVVLSAVDEARFSVRGNDQERTRGPMLLAPENGGTT